MNRLQPFSGQGAAIALSVLALLGCGCIWSGCRLGSCGADSGKIEKTFRGIRPSDPGGRDGLMNPERGLRIESPIAEKPGDTRLGYRGPTHFLRGVVPDGYTEDWWVADMQHSGKDGVTLALAYCYLDLYSDKPIAEEKLTFLKRALARFRAEGKKALLRFAYEKDMDRKQGPTADRIIEQLGQLAPILRENSDVIWVLQAGLVGAWGEWHNSTQGIENDHAKLAAIMKKLLSVLPEDRMTQVRVPKYKRWVLSEPVLNAMLKVDASSAFSGQPAARIGFHNDGFLADQTCGGTWTEPPFFSKPGNPEFDYMTQESAFLPVDGEMFVRDYGGRVDGMRAAIRMRLHHYASFSYAHSYSEREDGKPYGIDVWKKTPIRPEELKESGMPVSDGYFEGADGKPAERTQFEYIRDHLGYRIELQKAVFPRAAQAGKSFAVDVSLINRGFSVLHNPRPVCIVLVGADDTVVVSPVKGLDPRTWQPYRPGDPQYQPLTHAFSGNVILPAALKPGRYVLGLWMPDGRDTLKFDPRYAVRVANRDVPWWVVGQGRYGVNVLGEIEVNGS